MSRRINITLTGKSDLLAIFKNRLDRYGYKTWKELTNKVDIENERAFIDFFNGKQCLTREQLERTFEILEIPIELLGLYTEKIVKYKIKDL